MTISPLVIFCIWGMNNYPLIQGSGITLSHCKDPVSNQSGFNGSCHVRGGNSSLDSDQNVRLFGTDCFWLRWWKTTQFYGDIYFKDLRKPWNSDPVNKPTKISCNVTKVFLLHSPDRTTPRKLSTPPRTHCLTLIFGWFTPRPKAPFKPMGIEECHPLSHQRRPS